MSNINDMSVVKQQYANANNLNTRISIHDKFRQIRWGLGIGLFQIIELIRASKF